MTVTRREILSKAVALAALPRISHATSPGREGAAPATASRCPQAIRHVLILHEDHAAPVERAAVDAFARRLRMRSESTVTVLTVSDLARLDHASAARFELLVKVILRGRGRREDAALDGRGVAVPESPEGFALEISDACGSPSERLPNVACQALVAGRDLRGVLFGLGKLLRIADYHSGGFSLPVLSLSEAPAVAQRCAYLASHFNNYYERAPVEEIETYIEDLAFWGFNEIWTWFDMNWYPHDFGDDPDGAGMRLLERIRCINMKASALGLTTGMIGIANEGFRKHAAELRADMSEKRGGYYPESAICPSKPGGLQRILLNRRKVLELAGRTESFVAWPFDQGGCGCSECRPWVTTFLSICPDIAREVQRANPEARFYLSTWMFNEQEMEQVRTLIASQPEWLHGIVTDATWPGRFDLPGSHPRLVFSDVSMAGSLFTGYGASGANPMPHRFLAESRLATQHGFGGAVYSEGVYEDINKVIWACSQWTPGRTAVDIVQEYASFYFGSEHLDDWVALILGLEATWPPKRLPAADPRAVHSLFASAERLGNVVPAYAPSRLRWRYLHDRAEMDSRMVRIGPDRELFREGKQLFDDCGYTRDLGVFRSRLRDFRTRAAARVAALDELFRVHWDYLEHAYLERTSTLVITPPEFMGQRDWDSLLRVIDRALAETEDEAMRVSLLKGFKAWFWHDNITIDDLFL